MKISQKGKLESLAARAAPVLQRSPALSPLLLLLCNGACVATVLLFRNAAPARQIRERRCEQKPGSLASDGVRARLVNIWTRW